MMHDATDGGIIHSHADLWNSFIVRGRYGLLKQSISLTRRKRMISSLWRRLRSSADEAISWK